MKAAQKKSKSAESAATTDGKDVLSGLTFAPVTKECWKDFERLFEGPSAPKYCWCMAWRSTAEERKDATNDTRKAAIKKRVDAGTPVGILAYLGGDPIGWCSIAPRESYRPLGGPSPADGEKVWSVVCFFVQRKFRGLGLSSRLLEAAVAEAKAHGATMVEGYPVDDSAPSYRFMGFTPLFEEAGFAEVGRVGTRRHLMRRATR